MDALPLAYPDLVVETVRVAEAAAVTPETLTSPVELIDAVPAVVVTDQVKEES
jgi:hypothetical protein